MTVIDALNFKNIPKEKWMNNELILRDLNKAFIGFKSQSNNKRPVATDKWGCGAFRGDPEIKFLIQWMACSAN